MGSGARQGTRFGTSSGKARARRGLRRAAHTPSCWRWRRARAWLGASQEEPQQRLRIPRGPHTAGERSEGAIGQGCCPEGCQDWRDLVRLWNHQGCRQVEVVPVAASRLRLGSGGWRRTRARQAARASPAGLAGEAWPAGGSPRRRPRPAGGRRGVVAVRGAWSERGRACGAGIGRTSWDVRGFGIGVAGTQGATKPRRTSLMQRLLERERGARTSRVSIARQAGDTRAVDHY
mmetsp:Transcript_51291/g.166308  ORF Transcript_51291/g.166308 Transcript_51291/m.166308 type:complete len:233 (+) Transcript_51291:2793-3491(+)